MPKKGDDIGKLTLDATIDHLSNGDTISFKGDTFQGFYKQEYVEVGDSVGFKPTFTGRSVDLENVSGETSVKITSRSNNYVDKAFLAQVVQPLGNGSARLVLEEV